MKTLLLAIAMTLSSLTLGLAPLDAEARRLGGAKNAGMQRQLPPKQADAPPAQTANPATTAAPTAAAAGTGAAAAAGKRSWMGPIAGLAAGLGIAALLSHFGLGEGFANLMTMVLMAVAAFFLIRFLMRRFAGGQPAARSNGGLQFAGAGADGSSSTPRAPLDAPMQRSALAPAAAAASTGGGLRAQPEGFDAAAFERIAKMIFIRLQAANDAGQVDDLRRFTTPELFASLRLDLQERGDAAQQTDVVQLDAEVLDTAQEDGQWVVSVRFHGLIREQADGGAEPFDEVWHLVKPLDDSREWAIAGISTGG